MARWGTPSVDGSKQRSETQVITVTYPLSTVKRVGFRRKTWGAFSWPPGFHPTLISSCKSAKLKKEREKHVTIGVIGFNIRALKRKGKIPSGVLSLMVVGRIV